MTNSRKFKLFVLVFILFSLFSVYILASSNRFKRAPSVEGESTIELDEITVSATIGTTTKMIVYGYAPASSRVILTGDGISEQRNAEVSGWFSFDNIHSTESVDDNYPEICLVAYIGNLSTHPTCIPPLPGSANYEIGPVILSPIISIEQDVFVLGTQVALNGTTIPKSTVNIYFAENGGSLALVQRVLAYNIPAYQVESDVLGKFQLNLPSNTIAKWKVYASTLYSSSSSTKSNTLNFTVKNNVSYYLKKIYETIVRTTSIVTTVVTAKTDDEVMQENEKRLENISLSEVNMLRSRMPYYVMVIEGLLLIVLIIFIITRKRKKKKNNKKTNQK